MKTHFSSGDKLASKLFASSLVCLALVLAGCGGGGSSQGEDPYYPQDGPSYGFNAQQAYDQVVQTLSTRAFAMDAPFSQAAQLLAPYKNQLTSLHSATAFSLAANKIFKNVFGVSHVYLSGYSGRGASLAPLPFPPDDPRYHHTRAGGPPSFEQRYEAGIGNVSILNIPTFSDGYSKTLVELYISQAWGSRLLIVNVQDNLGGFVSNEKHLLGQILPDNSCSGYGVKKDFFDQYRSSGGNTNNYVELINYGRARYGAFFGYDYKISNSRGEFPGKVAVLINECTASAGESTAAALQELKNAFLVGKTSAGAVLTALIVPLNGVMSFTYPIEDYLTYSHRRIEKDPLQPYVRVSGFANLKEESIRKAIQEYRTRYPHG